MLGDLLVSLLSRFHNHAAPEGQHRPSRLNTPARTASIALGCTPETCRRHAGYRVCAADHPEAIAHHEPECSLRSQNS